MFYDGDIFINENRVKIKKRKNEIVIDLKNTMKDNYYVNYVCMYDDSDTVEKIKEVLAEIKDKYNDYNILIRIDIINGKDMIAPVDSVINSKRNFDDLYITFFKKLKGV